MLRMKPFGISAFFIAMRRSKATCVLIMFLIQAVATAQQPIPAGSSSEVTSPRPLADAARRLQETYGKAVTYEEPILSWRGELQAKPGHDPERKWELFPTPQSFLMPESGPGTDLASVLEDTIAAYHQQPLEPAFSYCFRNWAITLCPYKCTMRMDGLYRPPVRWTRS